MRSSVETSWWEIPPCVPIVTARRFAHGDRAPGSRASGAEDATAPSVRGRKCPLQVFTTRTAGCIPGEIQRGGIGPEGGLAVRDQYESPLIVETPVFGFACLKARQESGILETDETLFLRSYKGQRGGLTRRARKMCGRAAKRGLSREQVPILVVRDRSGATSDAILPKAHQQKRWIPTGGSGRSPSVW